MKPIKIHTIEFKRDSPAIGTVTREGGSIILTICVNGYTKWIAALGGEIVSIKPKDLKFSDNGHWAVYYKKMGNPHQWMGRRYQGEPEFKHFQLSVDTAFDM